MRVAVGGEVFLRLCPGRMKVVCVPGLLFLLWRLCRVPVVCRWGGVKGGECGNSSESKFEIGNIFKNIFFKYGILQKRQKEKATALSASGEGRLQQTNT